MVTVCHRHNIVARAARWWLPIAVILLTGLPFTSAFGWSGDSVLVLKAPGFYEELYHREHQRPTQKSTLSLALSGGGARGLAQIGVLRALEERDMCITGIAGSSLGAIIGGLYASGYTSADLDSLVQEADWTSLFSDTPPRTHLLLPQKDIRARSFLTLHFRGFKPQFPSAMTGGQPLLRMLTELCHASNYHCRSNFDSLLIPFRSVATDLISGQAAILGHGDLALCLQAASAFPLALYPVQIDSMMLVDGGLINPVPVSAARLFPADIVLAVNTTAELEPKSALQNIYGVANQSTTIMTQPQRERSLEMADVVITPPLEGFSNLDFGMADSIIDRGYTAACRTLDSLLGHQPAPPPDDTTSTAKAALDSITVTGLDENIFEHREIGRFLRETNPRPSTIEQLEKKLRHIINKGQVRQITARLEADSTGFFAGVAVEPYPLLTEVHFAGNSVFADSILIEKFAFLLGHPADAPGIAAALNRCLQLYGQQAYSLAEICAVELDNDTGRLTVCFDEGRLSSLEVTGNKSVKDWVVTRHFPLQQGRLFNYRAFVKGLEELYAAGMFSQVSGRITRDADGPRVILNVVEKDYDIMRFGLRHDLEYQTDVFVEVVNSNLLGLGNEIYLHVGYCPRRERYAAGLRADRIFRTYLTAGVHLYREIHQRHRYTDNHRRGFFETARKGLLVSFGQNLKRFGAISANFRSEDIVLTDQPSLSYSRTRLRSVILSLRYDDLDRLPFARRGRRADLSLELADDFAGGEVPFRKARATMENWLSPIGRFTIGQRLTLGTADRMLPDYERFALGGRQSMMGLHDDEFLGDKIILGNLDCRVRFFTRSYLSFRLAVGAVWEDPEEIHLFEDLRVAAGGGPSFDTPLGPLELMWGITENDYTNFYFNWGYDF